MSTSPSSYSIFPFYCKHDLLKRAIIFYTSFPAEERAWKYFKIMHQKCLINSLQFLYASWNAYLKGESVFSITTCLCHRYFLFIYFDNETNELLLYCKGPFTQVLFKKIWHIPMKSSKKEVTKKRCIARYELNTKNSQCLNKMEWKARKSYQVRNNIVDDTKDYHLMVRGGERKQH